ncbi:unnamed protein product [Paramecium sonneborni]|uniref:JAB1/MPN/MOV34 metalloenzyme domain-containing protein n=1 Tax=Paramecium sonneborni TaxID=65129 RepID=A0A8S1QZ87_9CILI|nr:unnamed protein product [Paramecium sonneborni]
MEIQNIIQQFERSQAVNPEVFISDTAEQVTISALTLIKMLKHVRAEIHFEVMGLLFGDIVDDYHIRVYNIFFNVLNSKPCLSEIYGSIYLIKDGSYQLYKQNNFFFFCYNNEQKQQILICTQQSYQQLNKKQIGVVIDPIQSFRGKVFIDIIQINSLLNLLSCKNQDKLYQKYRTSLKIRFRSIVKGIEQLLLFNQHQIQTQQFKIQNTLKLIQGLLERKFIIGEINIRISNKPLKNKKKENKKQRQKGSKESS